MRVLSPLRSCGVTKAEVRELSRRAGLFTWNKPAYACLATRIPAGTEISGAALQKIERGESALAQMGFSDFRLRMDGDSARIELTEEQMSLLFVRREQVLQALSGDFNQVTLNLHPRKGMEI